MFLSLIAVIIFLPVLGFAQKQERVISKISWKDAPIKIDKLQTKGKTIELGKKFSEEDDWLKGLAVTVENVSDKPISRIELDLSFPRPEGPSETIPTYVVKMIYGRTLRMQMPPLISKFYRARVWMLSCLRSIYLLSR